MGCFCGRYNQTPNKICKGTVAQTQAQFPNVLVVLRGFTSKLYNLPSKAINHHFHTLLTHNTRDSLQFNLVHFEGCYTNSDSFIYFAKESLVRFGNILEMKFPKTIKRFDEKPSSPRRQSVLAKMISMTRYFPLLYFPSFIFNEVFLIVFYPFQRLIVSSQVTISPIVGALKAIRH